MAHRTSEDSRDKIRLAHHYSVDEAVDASVTAYTAIVRGEYRGGGDFRRTVRKPAERKPARTTPERETSASIGSDDVRADMERMRIGPLVLTFACEHAEPGAYCWPSARGLCGDRVAVAVRARATADVTHERNRS